MSIRSNDLSGDSWWLPCFQAALARIGFTLNPSSVADALLPRSDFDVWKAQSAWASGERPYRLSFSLDLGSVLDVSTDFFYGNTTISALSGRRQVVHQCRQSFATLFKIGYHRPRYPDADMGFSVPIPGERLRLLAGTNYLVKSLWHSVVHSTYQGITSETFRIYRGQSREHSDFTADNLATILLATSYRLPVRADSESNPGEPNQQVVHLLRLNRCNRMFALRAELRGEDRDGEEQDWRTRRSIAIYLSGWLLAAGRSACSLEVHWGRDDKLTVEINDCYFATSYRRCDLTNTRQRADMLRSIAWHVDSDYRERLCNSRALREHVAERLESVFGRLQVNSRYTSAIWGC